MKERKRKKKESHVNPPSRNKNKRNVVLNESILVIGKDISEDFSVYQKISFQAQY